MREVRTRDNIEHNERSRIHGQDRHYTWDNSEYTGACRRPGALPGGRQGLR
jgi:hypothetical protein